MSALDPSLASSATRDLQAAGRTDSIDVELDDAGLIAAYRDGNLAAYGELARRHQIALFRLLLGLLGDEDLAEQACEQTFVIANRRLDELDEPARFYRWLLAIAREVSQEFLPDEGNTVELPSELPSSPAPRERLRHEIQAALRSLDPDHRLALILVEMREAASDEVAAALGVELGEVPAIVDAAREAFKAALARREGGTVPDQSSENRDALTPGTVIADRYRVESLLGAGGMGAVYLATTVDEGEEVAVKTMLPGRDLSSRAVRRFEREAEMIERLTSDRFVKLLDHGQTADDLRYLVMEYLAGRSLADCAHDEAPLAPPRALAIVADLLDGLIHAHGHGVVHRDLKPDNVMLVRDDRDDERPKILDLGLAKMFETSSDDISADETHLTRQGAVFGTPAYMAPEQALGKEVDARADLYAITVILFELLTGRLPFSGRNPSALLVKHVSQAPPSLASVAPHLADADELQALIDAGLAKQPDERIADARIFLDRIEGLALDKLATRSIIGTVSLPEIEEPSAAMYSQSPDPSSEPPAAEAARDSTDARRRDPLVLGAWVFVALLAVALGVAIYALS